MAKGLRGRKREDAREEMILGQRETDEVKENMRREIEGEGERRGERNVSRASGRGNQSE